MKSIIRLLIILSSVLVACNTTPTGRETLELNEGWKFKKVSSGDMHNATVPGYAQADLLASGEIVDPWLERTKTPLITWNWKIGSIQFRFM